jgi:Zn-dependent peptidase ImmA (M78 family)
MVATTRRGGALFAVKKGHKNSRAFAACRALFEYLTSKGDPAAVVAPTFSERQKRNRAFAAELLAPANRLRESLSAEIVSEEEIDDLAQQLDVSSYVVRHQIENHDLAQIVG